ncbi:MAG: nucleotidyl transferase AbiEii/AbiGii toxin family protein [Deltaproteobacteria bacterium]|nr:nucleotidyl transferase AbiEii/AbiGii toxin family protein [Deltaproteobacteria bacterium]
MKNRILTEKQEAFIDNLPDEILAEFYLTGGTALSAFYVEHRLSKDLDFFTDTEKQMPRIEFLIALLRRLASVNDIRYERLFDRRIFEVVFKDSDTLKVEFSTYPFKSIEERRKDGRLVVDSLLNIVTGKLFALSDRYDPKDFVDLYFVLRNYDWRLGDLIRKTKERFEIRGLEYIIPERLLLVKKVGLDDLPIMLKEIDAEEMKRYFLGQVSELAKELSEGKGNEQR